MNYSNYHDSTAATTGITFRIQTKYNKNAYLVLRFVFLHAILVTQRPQHQQYSSSSSLLLLTNSFSWLVKVPSISQRRQQHHLYYSFNKRNNRSSRSMVFQSSVGVDANSSTGGSSSNSNNDDSSVRIQQQQQMVVGVSVVETSQIQSLQLQNEKQLTSTHIKIDDDDSTVPLGIVSKSAVATTTTTTIDTSSNEIIQDYDLLRKNIFNAALLGLTFGYAAYTIFNIDHGMTRGWTQSEIAMRIPLDNWLNYESSLTDRPIATKTAINVIIYLLGDWLSQTAFSGNHILNFDAARTIRNGFIGLCFGPLVHEYYQFSDHILPVDGGMFVRLQKIIMDQTIYLSVKCSIYISAVGLLRGDDISTVKQNVQTKLPNIVLTAWKFWPLVHLVTYGVIPARHRILWVNCVDLIWNAILATMSQKKTGTDDDTDDVPIEVLPDGGDNSMLPPLIYEATFSDEPLTAVTSIESSALSSSSTTKTIVTTGTDMGK